MRQREPLFAEMGRACVSTNYNSVNRNRVCPLQQMSVVHCELFVVRHTGCRGGTAQMRPLSVFAAEGFLLYLGEKKQ